MMVFIFPEWERGFRFQGGIKWTTTESVLGTFVQQQSTESATGGESVIDINLQFN